MASSGVDVEAECYLHSAPSYPPTGVYNPKAFIPHAASLGHAFAHCRRFSTAASRRSLGSVSVPVWPVDLSVRLPVGALVSRYLTNKLIGHRSLPLRQDSLDIGHWSDRPPGNPAAAIQYPVSKPFPAFNGSAMRQCRHIRY